MSAVCLSPIDIEMKSLNHINSWLHFILPSIVARNKELDKDGFRLAVRQINARKIYWFFENLGKSCL